MKKSKKIIGIDPGLQKTGWAIINSFGSYDQYISHGVIITKSSTKLEKRLNEIFIELSSVFSKHCPETIAVEKIFSNKNPESSLKLGKARAIIFLVAARARGISYFNQLSELNQKESPRLIWASKILNYMGIKNTLTKKLLEK